MPSELVSFEFLSRSRPVLTDRIDQINERFSAINQKLTQFRANAEFAKREMLRVKSPAFSRTNDQEKKPLSCKDDEPEFIYDFTKALSPQVQTPADVSKDRLNKARALRLSGISVLSS